MLTTFEKIVSKVKNKDEKQFLTNIQKNLIRFFSLKKKENPNFSKLKIKKFSFLKLKNKKN